MQNHRYKGFEVDSEVWEKVGKNKRNFGCYSTFEETYCSFSLKILFPQKSVKIIMRRGEH